MENKQNIFIKNEMQDLEKQDLENPARKTAFEKQDLENPARKTAFFKSRAKTDDETMGNEGIDGNEEHEELQTSDIEYNIDYLVTDDEKLINIDNVKSKVDTYIDNYNSETMKEYKLKFDKLYQKYSNKKYKIKILPIKDKYNSTKIVVTKNENKKNIGNETIITEITKPNYIFYDNNSNLYNLKNNISNKRAELLYKYEVLVSQLNVSIEDKKLFEKEREEFINLLEEYYIYSLYHKKINKISLNNKTKLVIQSKYNVDKNDTITSVLSGDTYYINNNLIESINNYNIDKLTNYNNIILQLYGKTNKDIKKDTKLIEEIKLYLNKKEKIEVINKIDESKLNQDNYINYIISRLPII